MFSELLAFRCTPLREFLCDIFNFWSLLFSVVLSWLLVHTLPLFVSAFVPFKMRRDEVDPCFFLRPHIAEDSLSYESCPHGLVWCLFWILSYERIFCLSLLFEL